MKKIILAILIILTASGCEYNPFPRCVAADDFGTPILTISSSRDQESNDFSDNQGNSSNFFSPNQVIRWKKTGFVTTGTDLVIRTGGKWTAWLSDGSSFDLLEVIKENPVKIGNDDKYKGKNLIKGSKISTQRVCGPYARKAPSTTGNANSESCEYIDLGIPVDNPGAGSYGAPCWFSNGYGAYVLLKRPQDPDPNDSLNRMRYPESPVMHIGYKSAEEGGSGSFSSADVPVRDSSGNPIKIEYGWEIYAKILDRYYWDNAGGYSIEFLRGAYKGDQSKVFEEVRQWVRNILLDGSKSIFLRLTQSQEYINLVRGALILFVILSSISYIMGTVQMGMSDLIPRLLKMSIVLMLISPGSWEFFYNNLFALFNDGLAEIIAIINSHSGAIFNPEEPFYFMDYMIKERIFSPTVWNIKIKALVATNFGGIFWAAIICIVVIAYLLILCYGFIVFLTASIGIALLTALSPLVFIGLLFSKLKPMFDTWFTQCISFSMQAIMIFTLISLFSSLIMNHYYRTLGFTACHNDFIIFDFKILGKTTVKNWTAGQEFTPATVGFVWKDASYSDLSGNKKYKFTQGAGVIPVPPDYTTKDYRYIDYPFFDPNPRSSQQEGKLDYDNIQDQKLKDLLNALVESKNTFSGYVIARKIDEIAKLLAQANLPDNSTNNLIKKLVGEAQNIVLESPEASKIMLSIALEQLIQSNNLRPSKESTTSTQEQLDTVKILDKSIESLRNQGSLNHDDINAYTRNKFSAADGEIKQYLSQIIGDQSVPEKYRNFARNVLSNSRYTTREEQQKYQSDLTELYKMLGSNAVLSDKYKGLDTINAQFVDLFNRLRSLEEMSQSSSNNYRAPEKRLKIALALGNVSQIPESGTHDQGESAHIDGEGYDYDIIENDIKRGNLIIYGELFGMVLIVVLLIHLRLFVQRVGASIAGGSPFINILGDQFKGMFDPRGSGLGSKIGGLFAGFKYKIQDGIGEKIDSTQDTVVRSVPGLQKFTNVAGFVTGHESEIKARLREQDTFKELHYAQAVIGTHLRNPLEVAKLAAGLSYDALTAEKDAGLSGVKNQMQMQYKTHLQKIHDLTIGYKPPKPENVLDPQDANNPFKKAESIKRFGNLEYNQDGNLRIENDEQLENAMSLRAQLEENLQNMQNDLADATNPNEIADLEQQIQSTTANLDLVERSLTAKEADIDPSTRAGDPHVEFTAAHSADLQASDSSLGSIDSATIADEVTQPVTKENFAQSGTPITDTAEPVMPADATTPTADEPASVHTPPVTDTAEPVMPADATSPTADEPASVHTTSEPITSPEIETSAYTDTSPATNIGAEPVMPADATSPTADEPASVHTTSEPDISAAEPAYTDTPPATNIGAEPVMPADATTPTADEPASVHTPPVTDTAEPVMPADATTPTVEDPASVHTASESIISPEIPSTDAIDASDEGPFLTSDTTEANIDIEDSSGTDKDQAVKDSSTSDPQKTVSDSAQYDQQHTSKEKTLSEGNDPFLSANNDIDSSGKSTSKMSKSMSTIDTSSLPNKEEVINYPDKIQDNNTQDLSMFGLPVFPATNKQPSPKKPEASSTKKDPSAPVSRKTPGEPQKEDTLYKIQRDLNVKKEELKKALKMLEGLEQSNPAYKARNKKIQELRQEINTLETTVRNRSSG